MNRLIEKLCETHTLSVLEFRRLIDERTPASAAELAKRAVHVRKAIYGNTVFVRGLIEISNHCRNDCLYCGIRRSNQNLTRYRLSPEEILQCAAHGYALGFRTFVLQGGEDPFYSDELLVPLLRELKRRYPDCAVTLSLGERSYESYSALKAAGADRYLLRHETADPAHYGRLHPTEMSFENRMRCLRDLRNLGFQVGVGMMIGSPGQTSEMLAKDLAFISSFKPDMCGIGPFLPQRDTPFANEPAGSADLTCYLLSVIRLLHPPVLLPATTALGSIREDGRECGILSGANVVMPNLSPADLRRHYRIYDHKLNTGVESASQADALKERMRSISYEIVTDRGDIKRA